MAVETVTEDFLNSIIDNSKSLVSLPKPIIRSSHLAASNPAFLPRYMYSPSYLSIESIKYCKAIMSAPNYFFKSASL